MDNGRVFGEMPEQYRAARPHYPAQLYEYLASLCAARSRALDCATGNGQAAVGLAACFESVCAFDASADQIDNAIAHPRVEYRVGPAEVPPYDGPFDLVIAAQAAHWFDLPAFYAALAPLAHADTVVAIWGYAYSTVEPAIDARLSELLVPRIDPFWAEGNRIVLDRYATIPFPFQELAWPGFSFQLEWTLDAYVRYLRTWSGVKLFERERGCDPLVELEMALRESWPRDEAKPVSFELVGRVGRFG
jgi:SAM-dependent methyltransferase